MTQARESILFVGNGLASAEVLSGLIAAGWKVSSVPTLEEALRRLKAEMHHVIVIEIEAPTASSIDALGLLQSADPDAPILPVFPSQEKVPDLIRRSVIRPAGYLVKPVELGSLSMAIDSALVYRGLLEENRLLKRELGLTTHLKDWVGCTPESQEVRKSITTAALATGPVLVVGEDGSGRRLAAELIHRHGRNPASRFLPIELGSLPEGELARLLEELLSSARSMPSQEPTALRPGALYLSELTALGPFDQQSLAELAGRALPFRILASAHPSIEQAVSQRRFRRDLFEWLSPLSIPIPPLRDRQPDIPVLIDHLLRRSCERFHLPPLGIPARAIDRFTSYDWPGNVAELSMVIERAVSIASAAKFDGKTLPEQFCAPPSFTSVAPAGLRNVSLRELLAGIEKRIILQTLERVDGSQKKAAEKLKLNPTTLHEKMKRYKILPERCRSRSSVSL